MTPETKAYFDNLEPLLTRVEMGEEGEFLNVNGLDKITLADLNSLASFFKPITPIPMEQVLNKLWVVFKGEGLNYLLDKPRYTGFEVSVVDNDLYAEVRSSNCGIYKLWFTLEGQAQRVYLYRLLSRFARSIDPHRHIDEDIVMSYDGTRITLYTGRAE